MSTQAAEPSKLVEAWAMKQTPEQTIAAIIDAVNQYGEANGGAKIKAQTADYVYVVFTTPLMKFQDDAEFYIDTDNGLVHFRSNSRVGSGDGGLNLQRYNQLTALYLSKSV